MTEIKSLVSSAEGDFRPLEPDDSAGEMRAGIVRLDISAFQLIASMSSDKVASAQFFAISPFPDITFQIPVSAPHRRASDIVSFSGEIQNASGGSTPGTYVMTISEGLPSITIYSPLGNFHITPMGGENARSTQEDPTTPPMCANASSKFAAFQNTALAFGPGDPNEKGVFDPDETTGLAPAVQETKIRVLFLYTDGAVQTSPFNGDAAALKREIEQAVANTNMAFDKSGIQGPLRVEAAAIEKIDRQRFGPAQAPSFSDDLENITRSDAVKSLRDGYEADVVSLIREEGGRVWGIAWELQKLSPEYADRAFNVVFCKVVKSHMVFAHELGHNLGAAHNAENVDAAGLYKDSIAWHVATNGQRLGTIMSYLGRRTFHYSNPAVDFEDAAGVKTGRDGVANNARAINDSKNLVSQNHERRRK